MDSVDVSLQTVRRHPCSSAWCGPTVPGWHRVSLLPIAVLLAVFSALAQDHAPDWQAQVRKYAEAQDWNSALRIIDQEHTRAPQDIEVRVWRARVMTWSGQLAEAEKEYLEILKVSRTDPDEWMGLASVYLREGKVADALETLNLAVELDPKRADLRAARARALRAMGERNEARMEFERALRLDPASSEARTGLASVLREPRHELRFGQDNDVFNFADANHDEWASLVSRWSTYWSTTVAGDFYQRGGAAAGKFVGSVTRRQPKWGAVTLGGAMGHDNLVIPKSEAFFDLDHGRKISEANFLRAVEFDYGQHWYWYQASRILTLNGAAIISFPQGWSLSIGMTGARSAFSGTGAEWRPSGITRLGFPLGHWEDKRISGNVFFAAGTEDFAQIDQIGRFASHTFGGGLRFQLNARQDVTGYTAYQKRTQNRTDMSFGLSYGIHF
jgi:tetratricopeptide (TPR) repeat protein